METSRGAATLGDRSGGAFDEKCSAIYRTRNWSEEWRGEERGEAGGEEGGVRDKMAALTSTSRMRCMYIFNRNGVCLHYHVWLRPHTTLSQQQDQKLMFGLLFSLKSFTAKMDPLGLAPIPSHPLSLSSNSASFILHHWPNYNVQVTLP